LDAVEQPLGKDIIDFSKVKVVRNKNSTLNGPVEIKVDLDDSYIPKVYIYRKAAAGVTSYQKTPYELNRNNTGFCEFYNTDTFVVPNITLASNLPKQQEGNCPIPKVNL
jgi:hypothetical protein